MKTTAAVAIWCGLAAGACAGTVTQSPPPVDCGKDLTQCGELCVDTQSDGQNCGACGTACDKGKFCVAGKCATSCSGGLTACGSSCVDLKDDPAHCGSCDKACPTPAGSNPLCANNQCGFACKPGVEDCNGKADDGCEATLAADPKNCGKCGNACPDVAHGKGGCANATCGVGVCDMGFADCNKDPSDGCEVDTTSDAMNCGVCGMACAKGGNCVMSACKCPGAMGAVCDMACVDLASDSKNCGKCGQPCPNDKPYCEGGNCSTADPDLVLYYNFEEGNGDAIDHSNPNFTKTNGTFMGSAVRAAGGALGSQSALHKVAGSGANDYLAVTGDVTKLNMTTGYSVMTWIKVVSANNGQGIIVFGSCCNTRQGYTLNLQAGGNMRFWGGENGQNNNYNAFDNTPVGGGQYHHVGYRIDASGVQMLTDGKVTYMDGEVNLPTSVTTADPNNSDGSTHLPDIGGVGVDNITGADVYIDEVKVYRRRLSDVDWQSAMNGKL